MSLCFGVGAFFVNPNEAVKKNENVIRKSLLIFYFAFLFLFFRTFDTRELNSERKGCRLEKYKISKKKKAQQKPPHVTFSHVRWTENQVFELTKKKKKFI